MTSALSLSPFSAMPFSVGSAEISMAPAVRGTVYQAVQRAEDASDGKDAAFENLITKMAKVVDDLLKEKAVSSQRIIQLESQRDEAEKASQSREIALHDALKTQGKAIIGLEQRFEALTKRFVEFQNKAFQKHRHDGDVPVVQDGTRTIYQGRARVPVQVPKYVSVPTY